MAKNQAKSSPAPAPKGINGEGSVFEQEEHYRNQEQAQEDRATATANETARRQNIQDRLDAYAGRSRPGSRRGALGLSGDSYIQSGQIQGLERGEVYYGQTAFDTGQDSQDIIKRRRERLEGRSPASTDLRESRNRRLRQAKGRGASSAEQRQIEREAENDIGRAQEGFESQRLQDFQKTIGNVLSGQTGLEMGYAGLEKSGEYNPPPIASSGLSVICSELHRQGYMSDELRKKDVEYGQTLKRHSPCTYHGYLVLAAPVVRLMVKYEFFTKLISIPAMAWARNMAGEKNFLGASISVMCEPICKYFWRVRNGWINVFGQFKKQV